MKDNNLKLILIGPPGAGKGTQANLLTGHYQIPHISSGDILRAEVSSKTELGNTIKSFMDKGEIGPVKLITEAILGGINRHDQFLLDGFPRTLYQAEELSREHSIGKTFFIKVSEDEIIKRITGRIICESCKDIYHIEYNPPKENNICNSCGKKLIQRSDDKKETVLNRLKVYYNETEPVIDFYKKIGILYEIDGEKNPELIFEEIKEVIG
jgi:adenylate kinase